MAKKAKASDLLEEMIENAQESGATLDATNAAEFIGEKPARKARKPKEELPAKTPKGLKVQKKKEPEKPQVMKKKSFDLSEETIKNLARLRHWEQLPNEGAAIEFILKPYFKKHPQEPLKNEQ